MTTVTARCSKPKEATHTAIVLITMIKQHLGESRQMIMGVAEKRAKQQSSELRYTAHGARPDDDVGNSERAAEVSSDDDDDGNVSDSVPTPPSTVTVARGA